MKRFLKAGLVLAALGLLLTGCNCYKQINKKLDTVSTSSTPSLLTLRGDSVRATYTVQFPANFFPKNAVVKITPVLKYRGGEMAGTPKYLQGEKVKDNYTVISKRMGGTYSQYVSFPYDPKANLSVLELRLEAKCDKNAPSAKPFNAFPMSIIVAEGISTVQLLADDFAKLALAPDNFKRVTQISDDAKIMFLINRANVRPAQLNSEDIKTLQDFIIANTDQPKKSISDVYTKSYASPDGPLAFNDRLSQERGVNTKAAMERKFKQDNMPVAPRFDVDPMGEDWEGFKELVEKSDIPEKDLILQILQMYKDPAKRDAEIKNMTSVFQILAEKILPELRRSKMTVNVDVEGLSDAELRQAVSSDINKLNVEEMLFAATLYNDNATKAKVYKAAADKYNDWRAWNNLGYVLAAEGQYDKAKAAFVKAAQLNSSSNEVINNLGAVALYEGNTGEAQKFLSSINTPESKYNMGLVWLAQGKYAEATRVLDGYNLAVAEVCNGNLSRAKSILANDNTAKADYLKAIIAAKEGNVSQVASNLKAAIAKDPSYEDKALDNIDFAKYLTEEEFITVVKIKERR